MNFSAGGSVCHTVCQGKSAWGPQFQTQLTWTQGLSPRYQSAPQTPGAESGFPTAQAPKMPRIQDQVLNPWFSGLCCGVSVRVPQVHLLRPTLQCDGINKGALGEVGARVTRS